MLTRSRHAAHDFFGDPAGIFTARIVRCDDDDLAQAACHRAHQRTLRPVAIAAASEDGDQSSRRHCSRGLEQVPQRIVGVRVVDDGGDVVIRRRNHFEASRHARERRETLFDCSGWKAQTDGRGDRREDVVGVRAPDQAGPHAYGSSRRCRVEAEPGQRQRQLDGCDVRRAPQRVGHRRARRFEEIRGLGIVEVDDGGSALWQQLEQSAFRGGVRFHVAVEVEMVSREIHEDAGRKMERVDTPQCQRMRRHLHDRRVPAAIDHVAEERLEIGGLRRRPRRVAIFTAGAVDDGTEQAGRKAGGFEDRTEQVRRRGLAVGAGDARETERSCRMVVERGGEDGNRQPRIGDEDPGTIERGGCGRFCDDERRPPSHGLGRECSAVGLLTAKAHEDSARRRAPRVVRDAGRPRRGNVHRYPRGFREQPWRTKGLEQRPHRHGRVSPPSSLVIIADDVGPVRSSQTCHSPG